MSNGNQVTNALSDAVESGKEKVAELRDAASAAAATTLAKVKKATTRAKTAATSAKKAVEKKVATAKQ